MPRCRSVVACIVLALGMVVSPSAQRLKDAPGLKDPEFLTRMPNYFLAWGNTYKEKPFAAEAFTVQEGTKWVQVSVEGRVRTWTYTYDRSVDEKWPTPLQIQRNYQNAVKKIGGKVLWSEPADSTYCRTTLQLVKQGKEIWIGVYPINGGNMYTVTIAEKGAMGQDVVANAEALKTGLGQQGHVEVPGIFFDTNQSVLKPESAAAVSEVAKMLKASPSLKVWVVGHTDATGVAASNLTLSSARAASVVKELIGKHGIAAARLGSFGAGPYAPVAPNTTDEGRAQNRRVELVAHQ